MKVQHLKPNWCLEVVLFKHTKGSFFVYSRSRDCDSGRGCVGSVEVVAEAGAVVAVLWVGYDQNRIIWPETRTKPEFRFRLTRTRYDV